MTSAPDSAVYSARACFASSCFSIRTAHAGASRFPLPASRSAWRSATRCTSSIAPPWKTSRRPCARWRGRPALVDCPTARWRLGGFGAPTRLDIRIARGAERAAVVERIQALLPPGVHAAAVESLEQASAYPSRAYRVNLNVLAMVALFTGGFLVFSAQALETARRRGEHALLRVLGLPRRGGGRLVLLGAAALGALGAVLGLLLGYVLAVVAVRAWGGDLGAGAF